MLRRLGIGLALFLAGLLLLILGLFGAIQTAPGQRLVTSAVERLTGGSVVLRGLDGFVPFDMRVERLALIDAGEPWLEVEDAAFAWRPSRLLEGVLDVHEIRATRIEVARLPASEPDAEPEAEADEPFRLPDLPESLPLIHLDDLTVDHIVLGEPVLGERAEFSLGGFAASGNEGRSLDLSLALERRGGAPATASLDATLTLDPATLALDLLIEEDGRLVERLVGLRESGDFSLRLVGNGPLSAWRADLTGGGAGLGTVEAVLGVELDDQPRTTIDATIRPGRPIMPDELEAIVGDVALTVDVTQTGAQAVRLDRLGVDLAAASLAAEGRSDFDQRTFALTATLTSSRLAAFEPLAGLPLAGDGSVRLEADGSFDEPAGTLDVAVEGLAAGALADRLDLTVDYAALAPLSEGPNGTLSAEGRVGGLEVAGVPVQPGGDVTLRLDARRPADQPLALETLEVGDGNLAFAASGTIRPEEQAADLDLSLILARVGDVAAPFGVPLEGRFAIDGKVTVAERLARIGASLDGGLEDIRGLDPGLAALAGERIDLVLDGTFEPGEAGDVNRLLIRNDQLELEAEGRVDLATDDVAADLTLSVGELATLEPLAGVDLAGSVGLVGQIRGSLDEPVVEAKLAGQDLILAGRPVQALALDADLAGLDPLSGALDLDLALPRLEAGLAARYRLEGDTLALDDVALTGPGVDVSGAAEADLASGLVDGAFRGRVAELRRLDPLLPVPLRGALDLELDLARTDGTQSATASTTVSGLRGPFGALDQVRLRGRVDDALGTPRLDATLDLRDFQQEGTSVERLEATASGTLEDLAVDLSVLGAATFPFEVDADANVALGDATRIRLATLDGRVADQALRLGGPVTVTLDGPVTRVEGLDLTVAGGRLRGEASIGPGPVSGTLRLDGLPLANLEPFGLPPLAGTARASVDLSGRAEAPAIDAEFAVPNLRSPDPGLGDVPPVDLLVTAALAGQQLEADLRAGGLTATPVTGRVALPVQLDLATFAFAVPEDGALGGGLDAELQLQRVGDLLALDDQRLEGLLVADLALGGTVASPALDGRVLLEDGLYENGTSGTVLRDITLRAAATPERVSIDELSATDGGRGRLEGGGEIGLAGEGSLPVDLRLALRQAKLVRRDDVEATISGDIGMTGDLLRSAVTGRLTIDRVEASLPEPSGGPDVAVLDVEEVGNGVVREEAPAEEEEDGEITLDLDIAVPGRFYVRGRGLESEWQGDLEITGTADEPNLVGILEIRRGTFDFLDRRFELRQGQIEFTGAVPPTPEIAVEAAAEADDVLVIVRADGTPDDLAITLTSEPELPEDEVLAKLLFDRDISEISAAQAATLAMAVNRLRGGSGGLDILGRARKALGVDTLDVGGAPGEETVRAGKYLSDDVYVEVEEGRGEDSGRARVEMEILPNVSIEADTGQDARSGVGVKWKFDY